MKGIQGAGKGIIVTVIAASLVIPFGRQTFAETPTTWPTPIVMPGATQAQEAQTATVTAAQPTQAPAAATQPTPVPTAAPAAVTPNPIPASQAASVLNVQDIIALVGTPRLNTSPVASQAPVVTNVAATASI